jgi:hypothetical protein
MLNISANSVRLCQRSTHDISYLPKTEFPPEILTLRELEECAFAIIETRPFLPGLRSLVIHFELDSDIYDDCDAELQRATKLINDTFSGVEEVLCLKEREQVFACSFVD